MKTSEPKASCCAANAGCCGNSPETPNREITIDFLYLDLSVCERCQDTDSSLDEALEDVAKVLAATGVRVKVNKVNVLTAEQAQELKFLSSPTIRIDGCDIQLEVHETECESCGDLCGDSVDCRVWTYQGEEFTAPPKALIVEAILKHVYGGAPKQTESTPYIMPENLRRFYAAREQQN